MDIAPFCFRSEVVLRSVAHPASAIPKIASRSFPVVSKEKENERYIASQIEDERLAMYNVCTFGQGICFSTLELVQLFLPPSLACSSIMSLSILRTNIVVFTFVPEGFLSPCLTQCPLLPSIPISLLPLRLRSCI